MPRGDPLQSERLWLVATGLLLVTMPAFTLVVVYAVLAATQSALVQQVTTVELLELYLVEFGAFALFSYLLYRLLLFTSDRQELAGAEPSVEERPTDDVSGGE